MKYQRHKEGTTQDWQDCPDPLGAMEPGYNYRVFPEPAAPKWPQTTMTYEQLETAYSGAGGINSWDSVAARVLANAAIAHACESGALVPADKANENALEHYQRGLNEGATKEWERNKKMFRTFYATQVDK